MVRRVCVCSKVKFLRNGAVTKVSFNRAFSYAYTTRNRVTYPCPGWSKGDTLWRTEPTPVEMVGDEMWIAEKFQSNSDIAGSPRNSFRASLGVQFCGGKALTEGGAERLPISIKLRMPQNIARSQTVWDKSHGQKGNSPDLQLRSLIYAQWKRM